MNSPACERVTDGKRMYFLTVLSSDIMNNNYRRLFFLRLHVVRTCFQFARTSVQRAVTGIRQ